MAWQSSGLRLRAIMAGLPLAFGWPGGAVALTALEKQCKEGAPDAVIQACTTLINTKREKNLLRAVRHFNRAIAWTAKGECDIALADIDAAIRLSPNPPDFHSNFLLQRGFIWKDCKGDDDRAIEEFTEAMKVLPSGQAAYTNRGSAWLAKGELDLAIADYNESIRRGPDNDIPLANRAIAWRDKGELDRALADNDAAIRANPKYALAYANRGEIWRLKGDLDRSLSDLNKSLSLNPKSQLGYVLRADTYRYKGDIDRALADYAQALRLEPEYIPAIVGRGLAFEKRGQLEEARAAFKEAAAVRPKSAIRDISKSSLQTAIARLAALESGAPQPTIPNTPAKATSLTSIPTPSVTASPRAPSLHQGRRIAMIIGNAAYRTVSPLANPHKDAELIAASLRNIGFDKVELVSDASREALVNALRAFAEEAEKADWAVVYYAGHGIEVNGINYLIPVDAKLAADRDVQFETVPLDQVMAAVEGARKLKVVILDACRDNPFAPNMRKTAAPDVVASRNTAGGVVATRSIGRGLGEVKVSGATLVVYAAKHGQIALDGEGGNSPFAVALVQRVATPGVEINKIFRLVRDDVMEATAGRQEPFTYGSLPGREDFFFVSAK